jgi:hypothetical protein
MSVCWVYVLDKCAHGEWYRLELLSTLFAGVAAYDKYIHS